MEFRIYEVIKDHLVFRIEEDYPDVGAYLYVFEKEKCVRDYLQNGIEECKAIALEDYNIPIESWKARNND